MHGVGGMGIFISEASILASLFFKTVTTVGVTLVWVLKLQPT